MKSGYDRKAATIAIAGAVALCGWAVGTSAAAARPAPGAYTLVNAGSGLCLGAPGRGQRRGGHPVTNRTRPRISPDPGAAHGDAERLRVQEEWSSKDGQEPSGVNCVPQ